MATPTLLERMAALREASKAEDPVCRSTANLTEPATTLATFLILYNKANKDCFVEYMHGAKDLHRWLTFPNSPLDWELDKYPEIDDPTYKIPGMLSSWEASELGAMLVNDARDLKQRVRATKAISVVTIALLRERKI